MMNEPQESQGLEDMASAQAPQPREEHCAFMRCVERLEALIELETRILKSGEHVDFETLNQRKSHALLEFLRVTQSAPEHGALAPRDRLERLRELLSLNAEALERRLQAAQEVSAIIIGCIRKDESDGTYSRQRPGPR